MSLVYRVIQSQRSPEGHWKAVSRGRAYLEEGRPDLAFGAVQHIRDERPGAGEAMTVAGLALVQFREFTGARLTLERALSLQPNQLDAARALAELNLGLGNGPRGVELLQKVAELDPSDGQVWSTMGKVYHDLGETAKAVDAYEQALRRNPTDRETRLSLIRELLEIYKPERARKWVNEALREQPDDAQVLGLAARLERDSSHPEEAVSLADRALSHDPNNTDALLVRARIHVARNEPALALADVERAVQVDPNDVSGLQLLAQVQTLLGQNEQAAQTMKKRKAAVDRAALMDELVQTIARNPDDPAPRCRLGEAAAEGGLTLLANQCFQAALALNPNYQPAKQGLASLQSPSSATQPARLRIPPLNPSNPSPDSKSPANAP
jgi:tetratricopeptide (TPR) repeat protein